MQTAQTIESRLNRCNVAVHALGPWETLDRFLVLGSAIGTYYASAGELRIENLGNLLVCLDADGARTVARIREISFSGRAPKNLPAVMALAVAASVGLRSPRTGHFMSADRTGDTVARAETRRLALQVLSEVCRIPTDLFAWVAWVRQMRGWGPALARAVAGWYEKAPVDRLALHAIKYQERHGMRHADLIRLSHPRVGSDDLERQAVIRWMNQGGIAQGLDARERALSTGVMGNPTPSGLFRQLEAAEDLLAINRPAAALAERMSKERAVERAAAREAEQAQARLQENELNWSITPAVLVAPPFFKPSSMLKRHDASMGLFGVGTHMLRAADAFDYLPGSEDFQSANDDEDRTHDYVQWMRQNRRSRSARTFVAKQPSAPKPSLVDPAEVNRAVELIEACSLPHEVVPSHLKREPKVWDALLVSMPMKAMLRNLGTMTILGVLVEGNDASRFVAARLQDPVLLAASRIHPVALLMAAETYRQGCTPHQHMPSAPLIWGGKRRRAPWKPNKFTRMRRQETWTPVPLIIQALEKAFVLAFGNVQPSGKRILNALDVSGSMCSPISNSGITARVAAAAMSLVSVKTEANINTVAFTYQGYDSSWSPSRFNENGNGKTEEVFPGLTRLGINQSSTLREITELTHGLSFGSTDCALPVTYALAAGLEVDCFVIYTDNEHNSGDYTPSEALALYREATGIPARMICVGMTATDYTIADPHDALCLNIAGFDSAVPSLITDFAAGRV